MKKIKRYMVAIACASTISIPTIVLTSCSATKDSITNYKNVTMNDYKHGSEQIKEISKRSLSLKIFTENKKNELDKELGYVYGTGWIIGRANTNPYIFNIMTNLHVASFIKNSKENPYTQANINTELQKIEYSNKTPDTFIGLDVGIVGDIDSQNNLTSFGASSYKETANNELKYIDKDNNESTPSISPQNVIIPYSGVKAFENEVHQYVKDNNVNARYNPLLNPGNYVINPTSDFAILQIDFSEYFNNGNNNNQDIKIFKEFLDYSYYNPIKFADSFIPGEEVFIGGFPAATLPNDSNEQIINPRWEGLSNVKTMKEYYFGYNDATFRLDKSLSDISTALWSEINYIDQIKIYPNINVPSSATTQLFNSFRNIAMQGQMPSVDLLGGSSGSMVVNSKNEVVGIYWGGVQYISPVNIFSGRFDLFNSDNKYTKKGMKYNFLNTIEKYMSRMKF